MIKKLLTSLIFSFVLLNGIRPANVYAEQIDLGFPDDCDSSYAVYCERAYACDGNYAQVNNNAAGAHFHYLWETSENLSDVDDSFTNIKYYIKARYNYAGSDFYMSVGKAPAEPYLSATNVTAYGTSQVMTLTNSYSEYVFDFENESVITGQEIRDGRLGVYLGKNSGLNNHYLYIDCIKAYVVNEDIQSPAFLASVDITDIESSPSAGIVKMDLEGDTATASANMSCDISVWEECTKEGFAGWTDRVGEFKLDGKLSTPSAQISSVAGIRYGYDWNNPEGESTFKIDDFEVPYNESATCNYQFGMECNERIYTCTEIDGVQHCYWTDTINHLSVDPAFTTNLIATTSASLTEVAFTEPEPSNPIQWIAWKIKSILWEMFNFSSPMQTDQYHYVKEELESRAPFAYVLPVFDLNTSNPASSSAIPEYSFSFGDENVLGEDSKSDFVVNDEISGLIGTLEEHSQNTFQDHKIYN